MRRWTMRAAGGASRLRAASRQEVPQSLGLGLAPARELPPGETPATLPCVRRRALFRACMNASRARRRGRVNPPADGVACSYGRPTGNLRETYTGRGRLTRPAQSTNGRSVAPVELAGRRQHRMHLPAVMRLMVEDLHHAERPRLHHVPLRRPAPPGEIPVEIPLRQPGRPGPRSPHRAPAARPRARRSRRSSGRSRRSPPPAARRPRTATATSGRPRPDGSASHGSTSRTRPGHAAAPHRRGAARRRRCGG